MMARHDKLERQSSQIHTAHKCLIFTVKISLHNDVLWSGKREMIQFAVSVQDCRWSIVRRLKTFDFNWAKPVGRDMFYRLHSFRRETEWLISQFLPGQSTSHFLLSDTYRDKFCHLFAFWMEPRDWKSMLYIKSFQRDNTYKTHTGKKKQKTIK